MCLWIWCNLKFHMVWMLQARIWNTSSSIT
jgi:hypothetical protein